MTMSRRLPEDPLTFIKEAVRERRLFWTYHVNMRLAKRSIGRSMILESVESYEIVESYPDDKYLPSYLVLTSANDQAFHVLFAIDVEGGNVRIVTAYQPDLMDWEPDLRRRKA